MLLIAYIYVKVFNRKIRVKDIWLIKEKANEARDNGFCLYKYLREKHPKINAYYVISKDSPDIHKVELYGNVIHYGSLKHFIYYAVAKYSIGSQINGAIPPNIYWLYKKKIFLRKDQKVVFLQHGIIKDDIPNLYYENTNLDLFVCAASREYAFVKETFHYPEQNVQLLGLCRFDNLYGQTTDKSILIMPTYRRNLEAQDRLGHATYQEKERFMHSQYYQQYASLLNNSRLLEELKKTGYKLIFYPHYVFQTYIDCFQKYNSTNVIIADRYHYDVQELLKRSSFLITDFSSVYFDFAYLNKPMVFFQFDESEYRKEHYSQGYFDYRADGFGPVYTNEKDIVEYVVWMINRNCQNEEKYVQRVKSFFPLRDQNNCERTYQAILNL